MSKRGDSSYRYKETATYAVRYIEDGNLEGLLDYLDKNSIIPLHEIKDEKGFTLLHSACYKNSEEIGIALITRAKLTYT